ncbi:MAG: diguanylate cyclase [Deltaproteobacteria bacterium]|nr:MAG: diguanylate cyclase [Deltaproteobacteria bacterium]
MNLCIPITRDNGIQSPVSLHFGSAPIFMVVDTESLACRPITNGNLHHDHGMCQPLSQLAGERLDAMVVGGIGMGAYGKLKAANIRVFLSEHPTVEKTVAAFKTGSLREVTPATACAHHGNEPHGHAAQ